MNYYMLGSELLFENGNMIHEASIILGYMASSNKMAALVKVSGGMMKNQLLEVTLSLVSISYHYIFIILYIIQLDIIYYYSI